MAEFVFVGTEAEVAGKKITRYGERLQLTPEQVKDLTAEETGLPLNTAADFDGIGFTSDELKRYASLGARLTAPLTWWEKYNKSQALVIGAKPEQPLAAGKVAK